LRLRTLAGVTTNRRAAVGHGRPISG
jgi:hypothetical protein